MVNVGFKIFTLPKYEYSFQDLQIPPFKKRTITSLQFFTESGSLLWMNLPCSYCLIAPGIATLYLRHTLKKCNPFLSDLLSHENAATLNDVKTLVQQLYTTLCIEQHQLNKERELIERLEDLREQLAPLEKVQTQISDFSLHWYFFQSIYVCCFISTYVCFLR